jgi:hypothetical protein
MLDENRDFVHLFVRTLSSTPPTAFQRHPSYTINAPHPQQPNSKTRDHSDSETHRDQAAVPVVAPAPGPVEYPIVSAALPASSFLLPVVSGAACGNTIKTPARHSTQV